MKKIIFGLSLFTTAFGFSQTRNNNESKVWLSLLLPELRIEVANTEKITSTVGLGYLWTGEYESINGVETKNTIEGLPFISAMPKYRTTIDRRQNLGKTLDNFSGGYVALPIHYYLSKGYQLGLVYGTQGTWGRTALFFYNFNIGLGYSNVDLEKNKDIEGVGLAGGFNIGIRLK